MTMNVRSVLLLLASALVGCAASVHLLNPRPQIAIAPSNEPLRLELGANVVDTFDMPAEPGVGPYGTASLAIHAWRSSLAAGFQSGFARLFPLPPPAPDVRADRVLRIVHALPRLVIDDVTAVIVNAHGAMATVPTAEHAEIEYLVVLTDGAGHVLRQAPGIARSKFQVRSRDEGTNEDLVSSAIERMYEQAAAILFGTLPAPLPVVPSPVEPRSEQRGDTGVPTSAP